MSSQLSLWERSLEGTLRKGEDSSWPKPFYFTHSVKDWCRVQGMLHKLKEGNHTGCILVGMLPSGIVSWGAPQTPEVDQLGAPGCLQLGRWASPLTLGPDQLGARGHSW